MPFSPFDFDVVTSPDDFSGERRRPRRSPPSVADPARQEKTAVTDEAEGQVVERTNAGLVGR
jgi:hypothetical protein